MLIPPEYRYPSAGSLPGTTSMVAEGLEHSSIEMCKDYIM